MSRIWPSVGDRFGRLRFVCREPVRRGRFLCDCGTSKSIRMDHIENGKIVSCGCYVREITSKRNYVHGGSASKEHPCTPEFTCWTQIRGRCGNPNNKAYKYYGGRGITICERWHSSFENFLSDMGPRPDDKHSIDRIDVNGNYEPDNCRWATKHQQARNTRATKLSEEMASKIRDLHKTGIPKIDVARQLGVHYSSVKQVTLGKQWVEL